jgi:hypothetical protein
MGRTHGVDLSVFEMLVAEQSDRRELIELLSIARMLA